jgi:paraquat-inducible protein B
MVGQRSKRSLAWVWVIPLVAALIGVSIVWREWSSRGPEIHISFQSASGIEEGKTQIKYRDVVIGLVTDIRLSKNRENVVVTAQLDKDAEALANERTQFWIVKPTIGVTGVSGLATLFSGSYIEADTIVGEANKTEKIKFIGLEQPPPITSDRPGDRFRLRAPSLGSIQPGTPIYYLRIPVGVVTDYKLDPRGNHVDIDMFIDEPYDDFVNGNTRFWNESGVHVALGTNGIDVSVGSLTSLLSSGIAFRSFGSHAQVADHHVFQLFGSEQSAAALPQGPRIPVQMRFEQSTKGLAIGAPIDFHGVTIGTVERVDLDIDQATKAFYTRVFANLYPAMLGAAYQRLEMTNLDQAGLHALVQNAVDRGLRAQLRQGNLLTGSMLIALVDRPDTKPHLTHSADGPLIVPTIASQTFADIEKKVGDIIDKIDKIPFQQIGDELQQVLAELSAVGQSVNQTLTPELSATMQKLQQTMANVNELLQSSDPIPAQVQQTIQDLDDVLRSTRQLVDEIRERPDSLIFGEPSTTYSRETLGSDTK